MDDATIRNWFTYHPPTPAQAKLYERIRAQALLVASDEQAFAVNRINQALVPSHTLFFRIHILREAVMWANACVALHT